MMRLFTFFLFTFCVFPLQTLAAEQLYNLTSGEKGTPYHQTAQAISEYFQQGIPNTRLYVSESSGSIENMARLKQGLADYAIVQQNVALDAVYGNAEHYSNFEVILPLFPEALQVIVAGEHAQLQFSDLSVLINEGQLTSMAIGPVGSATNNLIKQVFSIFGVAVPGGFFIEGDVRGAVEQFESGQVGSIAHVAAYPSGLFNSIRGIKASLLNFDQNERAHILSHIQGMNSIVLKNGLYSFTDDAGTVDTIGTWALLIGQSSRDRGIDVSVAEIILEALHDSDSLLEPLKPSAVKSQLLNTPSASDPSPSYLSSSYLSRNADELKYFTYSVEDRHLIINGFLDSDGAGFFRGLELSADLKELLKDDYYLLIVSLVGLFFIALLLFLMYRNNNMDDLELLIIWYRYQHFFYAFFFVIAVYFLVTYAIIYSEELLSETSGLKNSFDEVNIFDVHIWLFVFSLTGYNGILFPQSFTGQVLATLSSFLIPMAAVAAIVGEFVFNFRDRRRRQGIASVAHENHIVICGWNDRVPSLIAKAMDAQRNHIDGKVTKIVIIAEEFKEQIDLSPEMQRFYKRREVEYVHGKARDPLILAKANIDKAETVILIAEDRTLDSDERTLLSALSISRYCREKCDRPSVDNIYMIAEINHEELRSPILNADVNEVVNVSDIGESLVVQSMFNHGVSTAVSRMLAYDEFNEFYVIDALEMPYFVGERFDEILPVLRRNKILLTSIKSVLREADGRIVIDEKLISQHLAKHNLSRQIITNPINEVENNYQLKLDDQLIVLSASVDTVKKVIFSEHAGHEYFSKTESAI